MFVLTYKSFGLIFQKTEVKSFILNLNPPKRELKSEITEINSYFKI